MVAWMRTIRNGNKRYNYMIILHVHESSVHDIVWNTDFNVFRGWSLCDSFYWAYFTWPYAGFSFTHISSGLIMSSYIGSSGIFFATHFLLITQKLRTKIAPERIRLRILIISKVFPESDTSVLLKPVCKSWVSLIIILYWIRILLC